jgi:Ca2+-binding RTX toxin-like protein
MQSGTIFYVRNDSTANEIKFSVVEKRADGQETVLNTITNAYVESIATDIDGNIVISTKLAGNDNIIYVSKITPMGELSKLQTLGRYTPDSNLFALEYSEDGRLFAAIRRDEYTGRIDKNEIVELDPQTFEVLNVLKSDVRTIADITILDGKIWFLDAAIDRTQKTYLRSIEVDGAVNTITDSIEINSFPRHAFTGEDGKIYIGSSSGKTQIYDPEKGILTDHDDIPSAIILDVTSTTKSLPTVNPIIFGTNGNDVLIGDEQKDTIIGLFGDDAIIGSGGDDVLIGSVGDDSIDGGSGDDEIFGGYDNDQIFAGAGDDIIFGNSGDDFIVGDASNTGGNDVVFGNSGADQIFGGAGDDQIDGGLGNDRIFGEDGNDVMFGSHGDDYIEGGAGNDTLFGDVGGGLEPSVIWDPESIGKTYNDTLLGGDGDDYIDGGLGDDFIYGNEGNDTLHGGDGNDRIFGGTGNDTLYGGEGDDYLVLGFDGGTVHGGNGNDEIAISSSDIGVGDRFVFAGEGDDTIIFGGGSNQALVVETGNGADVLEVRVNPVRGTGATYITDFEDGIDMIGVLPAPTFSPRVQIGATEDGSGTWIDIGGSLLILDGVDASSINQDDFLNTNLEFDFFV